MLTIREGAIISAFTGVLIGEFDDMHRYIEEKLNRSIFTHELASTELWGEIQEECKEDFLNIPIERK